MTEPLPAEQRRSERKAAEIVVTLVIEGEEADSLASGIDVSLHGMRLQTDVAIEPGQQVGLVLSDSPTDVIGARVVWLVKQDPDPSAEAGLEFLKPLAAPV